MRQHTRFLEQLDAGENPAYDATALKRMLSRIERLKKQGRYVEASEAALDLSNAVEYFQDEVDALAYLGQTARPRTELHIVR